MRHKKIDHALRRSAKVTTALPFRCCAQPAGRWDCTGMKPMSKLPFVGGPRAWSRVGRISLNRAPLRLAILLIPLVLAWLALSPTAQAVDPPPDGGYPNQNTAEGTDALFSLTTGFANTAIGLSALYSNTTGSYNTANGYEALYNNTTGSYNTATGALALTFNTTGNSNTAN